MKKLIKKITSYMRPRCPRYEQIEFALPGSNLTYDEILFLKKLRALRAQLSAKK